MSEVVRWRIHPLGQLRTSVHSGYFIDVWQLHFGIRLLCRLRILPSMGLGLISFDIDVKNREQI